MAPALNTEETSRPLVTELISTPDSDDQATTTNTSNSNNVVGAAKDAAPSAADMIKALQAVVPTTHSYKLVQIGCGVVGNAYAQAFVNAGHDVIGVEASRARMEQLADAYPMRHISEDLSTTHHVDFILLSINTPLDSATGALNMRYLWSSLRNVCALLESSPHALIVVRSTVTIGFCDAYRSALCERLGRSARVCFQPEFLRAKSALSDATEPWQVVIGTDDTSEVEDYIAFQGTFIDAKRISLCSIDEAEIMKIFHNSFNAMKISFFNQAHLLIDSIKKSERKLIDSHRTFKLIGRTCEGLLNPDYGLTPGHAYYGTCLPKDSAELAHMEKSYGLSCSLFDQVVKVNDVMRAQDDCEVLYGDNHADNSMFHQRTQPVRTTRKPAHAESPTGVQDIQADIKHIPELEHAIAQSS